MITHNVKLDMAPGRMPPVIRVSQYDSDFQIVFTVDAYHTGTFTMSSGTTAKVRGTKTDGTGYTANCSINTTAKTVTVTGNQQMTAAAGNCIYEIVLYYNSKELSSVNFILAVERAALDVDTIPSESRIAEIQEIGQKADQIIAAYQNLQFDSTPTAGSTKAVTSQGIKNAIDALSNVYQTKLTFDSAPTSGSSKPVTSGGVYTAINNIRNIVSTDPNSDGNVIISYT